MTMIEKTYAVGRLREIVAATSRGFLGGGVRLEECSERELVPSHGELGLRARV